MFRTRCRLVCCGGFLLVGLTSVICGCSDDGPVGPQESPDPTYQSIWPARAGNFWEYDAVEDVYDENHPMYDRIEDVPPIPAMEELYADLHEPSPGDVIYHGRGVYRMVFASGKAAAPASVVFDFVAAMDSVEAYAHPPVMLPYPWESGSAMQWSRSPGKMACYYEGRLVWLFFEGALTPGNEFEVLLDWNFDRDLIVRSRIWRIGPFDVGDRTYPKAVESLYVLDIGYIYGTDENGNPTGVFHQYVYGLMVYVPQVGLVYGKERYIGGPEGVTVRTLEILDFGNTE